MSFTEKQITESETARRLADELPRLLPNLTFENLNRQVKVGDKGRADLVVRVRSGNLTRTLLVEVKSIGEPRMAEQAITQLRLMESALPGAYPVFGAPYVSDRTREICKAEGVGYIDLVGNAYLQFGSVLVDRLTRGGWRIERRSLRSLYAPKATRVVRALLQAPSKPTRITDLANTCSMSLGGVFQVVDLLQTRGLVSRGEDKRILVSDPRRLLLDWAQNWSLDKSRATRYFSFEKTSERLISSISKEAKEDELKYAFTGMAGASMVAPFVRYDDVSVYTAGNREKLIERLDLRPVSSGANVVLLDPYDEGVFDGVREIRGASVVSDVQLFVDLYNYPARGREQAEQILEKALKFPEVR